MSVLNRQIQLCFVSAKPEYTINRLSESGVILENIVCLDPITVNIVISKRQYHLTVTILKKCFADITKEQEIGPHLVARRIVCRPILLLGIIVYFIAILLIPKRIFFFRVTGNGITSQTRILAEVEKAGIFFGCKSMDIRSEEIKNQVMTALPQLQWVGINTKGCVTLVHVQERSKTDESNQMTDGISSIVASRDGTISKMTVHTGMPLLKPGQAVKKGDVLVSGYTDCGLKVVGEHARAEVMAYTLHNYMFVSPQPTIHRGNVEHKQTCYRLRIGKKVINFCNHSGIQDTVCDKIYSEYYLMLPGGFQLPISWTKIESVYYEEFVQTSDEIEYSWISTFAQEYLQKQMVAGEILQQDLRWNYLEDCSQMIGIYTCHEMISQVKNEEIMKYNAEDN